MRSAPWFGLAIVLVSSSLRAQGYSSDPAAYQDRPDPSSYSLTEEDASSMRYRGAPNPRRGRRMQQLIQQMAANEGDSATAIPLPTDERDAPPQRRASIPPGGRPAFDDSGRAEDRVGAAFEPATGAPLTGNVPTGPLRSAYQAPDIFRTPNPTPLEQTPSPEGYMPQLAPGMDGYPALPPVKPEPPMPPLAPLVNIRFTDTWLPAARDDIGMNDFDLRGTLAMGRTGVFVTPGYGVHSLNGPVSTDLPARLYDAYVDIRWKKQFDEHWGLELAFTPSFFTDLENNSSDSWRFITTVLGFYQLNPELQLMAGVMYLDRFDINWFPIFGFIYTGPGDDSDWRYEVVFPRPKLARRILRGEDKDGWVYLSGEFGGGAWAVQRTNGADDMVAYRDWRAMLGYETKVKDFSALSWFAEVGYVFQRQLEYRSGFGDFDPDAAGMLRVGVSY